MAVHAKGPFKHINPQQVGLSLVSNVVERTMPRKSDAWLLPLIPKDMIKAWPSDQESVDKKAAIISLTATHAHYNRDLQFNCTVDDCAMTDRKCIGGRAWPSVILHEATHEYVFAVV